MSRPIASSSGPASVSTIPQLISPTNSRAVAAQAVGADREPQRVVGREVQLHVARVAVAHALRPEDLHRLADQLVVFVSEQAPRRARWRRRSGRRARRPPSRPAGPPGRRAARPRASAAAPECAAGPQRPRRLAKAAALPGRSVRLCGASMPVMPSLSTGARHWQWGLQPLTSRAGPCRAAPRARPGVSRGLRAPSPSSTAGALVNWMSR